MIKKLILTASERLSTQLRRNFLACLTTKTTKGANFLN
jgi:hypothetical protein